MTRVPLVSDSATFSAASRQIEQRMNRVSPSFHSLLWRSKVRGVDATVKLATAAPEGVKRSSGSPVRFPITVMTVSPAMPIPRFSRRSVRGIRVRGECNHETPTHARARRVRRVQFSADNSLVAGAQDLRPEHDLVEAELAVQLLGGRGRRGEVDDGVDALGLLRDVVGETAAPPDVH